MKWIHRMRFGAVVVPGLLGGTVLLWGCSFRNAQEASVDPLVFAAEFRPEGSGGEPARVEWPATVVVTRVGYATDTHTRRHGQGVPLKVLRTPDAAGTGPLRDLGDKLESVREVWVLQPEMLSGLMADDATTIRQAAQRLGADLLVPYSLSTEKSNTFHFPFLSVLTLGLIPNATAEAAVVVRAAVVEPTRGHVLHRFESHSRKSQITNYYVVHDDEDKAADRAEKEAFNKLLEQVEEEWPRIVGQARRGLN